MEKANKRLLVITVSISLITILFVYIYMPCPKPAAPEVVYTTVYVAARTMPARYKITKADIKQVKIEKELLNPSSVSDVSEITGKLTMERIIAGEQIIRERLAGEEWTLLSCSLPEGTRAVSMNVNEQISVTSLMRPGDYVDVVASFEKEEVDNGQKIRVFPRLTKTLLQNVKVLALGQDMTLSVDKLKELPATVTLAIREEDVEKFVYASEYGSLRLALRPAGDGNQNASQGISREDLTGTKGEYDMPLNGGENPGSNPVAN